MTKYMNKRFRKHYKILDKQKYVCRGLTESKLIAYELMAVGAVFAIFLTIMFLSNFR